ncbi:hypothetical protein B0T16DRAFT_453325 [Cercophora newfieldiana]|uniref:Uncharacterized protein n=1 Tax=Cercophora newfieldiana TaxID=92897 RepID=A0AA40D280_9PEZI|nr:hypothetical protein B0T16DRAFT_453325 [Cercophora newfieldiana]
MRPDSDPVSPSNLQRARHAIDYCVQHHHDQCPSVTSPLRLLNVLQGDFIRLDHTEAKPTTYATLSYCWGDPTIMNAVQSILEARRQGLSSVGFATPHYFLFEQAHARLSSPPSAGLHPPWSMTLDITGPLFDPASLLSLMSWFKSPDDHATETVHVNRSVSTQNGHPGVFCLDIYENRSPAFFNSNKKCNDTLCISRMYIGYADMLVNSSALLMGPGSEHRYRVPPVDEGFDDDKLWCFLLVEPVTGRANAVPPAGPGPALPGDTDIRSYRRTGTMMVYDAALREVAMNILKGLELASGEKANETIRLV